MNNIQQAPVLDAGVQRRDREPDSPATAPDRPPGKRRRTGRRLLAGSAFVLLCAALGIGLWQHYSLHVQVLATAEQRRDFVPSVRTAPVRASGSTIAVTWPGTTEAFEQANIYARASGYISRREVDIGSHVKTGQLLVEIRP
jgi:multidrug efflux pump subunit AcrA (membrane-fusion protein)